MRTTSRLFTVLLASSLTLLACGGEEKIGDDITISPDGEGGALRDPARTTTTLPDDIADQLGTSTTAPSSDGATNTTVAQTTTTEAPDVILVQDDDQGPFFDPYAYQIAVNRALVFRNVGTKVRVIVFDELKVKSPDIPPGGEWVYVFEQKGVFKFRDETRPYATTGRVQVF